MTRVCHWCDSPATRSCDHGLGMHGSAYPCKALMCEEHSTPWQIGDVCPVHELGEMIQPVPTDLGAADAMRSEIRAMAMRSRFVVVRGG